MKILLIMSSVLLSLAARSQELFSVTEPASNSAAGSIGFRVDNSVMDEINSSKINYHLIPSITLGISKSFMVSGNVFSAIVTMFSGMREAAFMRSTGF